MLYTGSQSADMPSFPVSPSHSLILPNPCQTLCEGCFLKEQCRLIELSSMMEVFSVGTVQSSGQEPSVACNFKLLKIENAAPQSHGPHFRCSTATWTAQSGTLPASHEVLLDSTGWQSSLGEMSIDLYHMHREANRCF